MSQGPGYRQTAVCIVVLEEALLALLRNYAGAEDKARAVLAWR